MPPDKGRHAHATSPSSFRWAMWWLAKNHCKIGTCTCLRKGSEIWEGSATESTQSWEKPAPRTSLVRRADLRQTPLGRVISESCPRSLEPRSRSQKMLSKKLGFAIEVRQIACDAGPAMRCAGRQPTMWITPFNKAFRWNPHKQLDGSGQEVRFGPSQARSWKERSEAGLGPGRAGMAPTGFRAILCKRGLHSQPCIPLYKICTCHQKTLSLYIYIYMCML